MKIYLVGGAVRDELLGLPVSERDWVVVGSSPEEMKSLQYRQVGKQFPVFLHPNTHEEYALARTEKKQGRGYVGFICDFSPAITIENDLMRRDFTINSIAYDTETKKYIDSTGGLADIKNKVIRHTSDAFSEDPLRLIRLARFYAKLKPLGFSVAPETISMVQEIVKNGELDSLSVERLWSEFEKAFAYPDPDAFLEILSRSNYIDTLSAPSLFDDACRKALRYAAVSHKSTIIRFAVWCCFAKEEDFLTLTKWLPIPNRYLELSVKLRNNFYAFYDSPQLTITNILKLITNIHGFKQGDLFENFICAAEIASVSRDVFQHIPHPQARFIRTMLTVAKTISTKSIMRLHLTGKELAIEIDKQRCAAMCKVRRPYRWAYF